MGLLTIGILLNIASMIYSSLSVKFCERNGYRNDFYSVISGLLLIFGCALTGMGIIKSIIGG